jgi:DNA-binding response OmpR family regulator
MALSEILIADDERMTRRLLEKTLTEAGYRVCMAHDGEQAWKLLHAPDAPRLAVLDWMMPGMDGVEICRRLRDESLPHPLHLILLTSRNQTKDVVAGLDSGADDYITKPFDRAELLARIRSGQRVLNLESSLSTRMGELHQAQAQLKQLQGLLPICMCCKKIRDDDDTWHRIETYIQEHSGASFSHSVCDECLAELRQNISSEGNVS